MYVMLSPSTPLRSAQDRLRRSISQGFGRCHQISTGEIPINLLSKNHSIDSLCLACFDQLPVPLRLDHIVAAHDADGSPFDFFQSTQERSAHAKVQILLLNRGDLREERMHLFQIVMPADKGDLLESALFHPLELMREERLPKERPERLLLQRSKTAGTAGEEEENMHGGHSNRFLRASPAHAVRVEKQYLLKYYLYAPLLISPSNRNPQLLVPRQNRWMRMSVRIFSADRNQREIRIDREEKTCG